MMSRRPVTDLDLPKIFDFPKGKSTMFKFFGGSHRANPRWKGASSKGSPSFSPTELPETPIFCS